MEPPVAGGRTRRVVIRTVLVLAIGGALLAPILYYASTVDVRPPQVNRFVLTQHLPGDDGVALTTSSLEVVFSEAVDRHAAQAAFTVLPQLPGSFSWSGATMVFTPADPLPLQTSFSVRPFSSALFGPFLSPGVFGPLFSARSSRPAVFGP